MSGNAILTTACPTAEPFADRTLAGTAGLAYACACIPLGDSARLNPTTAARTAARPNPKTIAFIVAIPHW